MPRYILKLETDQGPQYLEWSTIVDAPITYGMTLEEFRAFYKGQYGLNGTTELAERLKRVEATGTSAPHESVDEIIAFNRAGPGESCLTRDQLIERFCKQRAGRP